MQSLAHKLKTIRNKLNLSQKEMAKLMKVSLRTYQKYESEEVSPSYEKLVALLNELKIVNPTWLLTGEGPMFLRKEGLKKEGESAESKKERVPEASESPNSVKIPLYENVKLSAGTGSFVFEEQEPAYISFPLSLLRAFGIRTLPAKDELLVFPVQGNSMEPTIPEDSYVLIRRWQYEGLLRPAEGKIYALIWNQEFYIKRICLRFEGEEVHWKLISDNPDYPPLEFTTSPDIHNEVQLIGRVLGYFKKI